MRFGCCIGNPEQLPALERAGAEYCEVPASRLAGLDDDGFGAWVAALENSPVPARAANGFLPGHIRLTGPEPTPIAEQDAYVAGCVDRLRRLGVERLVFGSGTARAVPDGFDRERAMEQLAAFMRRASAASSERGITLVLEPLRRAETNIFNSVAEAGRFLRERSCGSTRLLADLFHMMEEGEPMTVLEESRDLLSHVHVADGHARRAPGTQDYDFDSFFRHLDAAGYEGRCSIECGWGDFDTEVGPGLEVIRRSAASVAGGA